MVAVHAIAWQNVESHAPNEVFGEQKYGAGVMLDRSTAHSHLMAIMAQSDDNS